MGFFQGRVSFVRYRVLGQAPTFFGPDHLAKLAEYQAGKQRLASSDGVEAGWTAADHILDVRFDQAKNVIDDMLFFALRIDTLKLPGDLLKAYFKADLDALAATNPSGRPSTRQKREARESARDRLEQEAKDGRYLKRKAIECVYDLKSNELLFGTASMGQVDRLLTLFKNTFGSGFEMISAGTRAFEIAQMHQQSRQVDDAKPSLFVPNASSPEIAWLPDESSRDFLGNEFMLWLWFKLETDTDTIKLGDDTEAAVMLARTLTLECPRGQTGHETISSEGPSRLPEARRAIQSGKLPRKMGMTIVRQGEQYEFTLHAETLAITACRMPPADEQDDRALLDARAGQIRHLIETMDLLYDAFAQVRCSGDWTKELNSMQRWLAREERRAA